MGKPVMNFREFFRSGTRSSPYAWQERLAEDLTCRSLLINIPTGLGKTAA
jgi:ERCC4-related helicase